MNPPKSVGKMPMEDKFHTFAPMKILMVCLGNICRSPLAEGILKRKANNAGLMWTVESAGTSSGSRAGAAPHPLSQKVARLHGMDISRQRARPFMASDFSRYDKVYAMAGDVLDEIKWIAKNKFDGRKAELLMNEIYPGKNLDIPDPWSGAEAGYHLVFKMMENACDAIIAKYKTPLPSPAPPKEGISEDFSQKETGDLRMHKINKYDLE
jgi:protein-tyrosine phosphatase